MKNRIPFLEKRHRWQTGILLVLAGVLYCAKGQAQTNIAPQAAVTQSFPTTGINGPANYNDGVIQAYPGTNWGYVLNNGAILFTWSTPRAINKIKFYKSSRPMSSCTLQYWNGTAYVDFYNYVSGGNEVDSVFFNLITTTRIRMNVVTGASPGANFREIEICKYLGPANDAGVSSVDSPSLFCGGVTNVVATVKNYGNNQLSNVSVGWTLNGVLQAPVTYSGLLDTIGGTGANATQITLGTAAFNAGTAYSFKVWTFNPNGQQDMANVNDTLNDLKKNALSGIYTIGATGSDYGSLSAAASDLKTWGVCGPVTFNVRSGTYTEQVVIDSIPGASALNTVTIRSLANSPDSVTVQYNSSLSNNYVFRLRNAKYVTIRSIGISPLNTTYGTGIELTGRLSLDTIRGCNILTPVSATPSQSSSGIIASLASVISDMVIEGNKIRNVQNGMYLNPTANGITRIQVENNDVSDVAGYGILISNANDVVVRRNSLAASTAPGLSFKGIWLQTCINALEVSANRINLTGAADAYNAGIGMSGCVGSAAVPQMIFNNIIRGDQAYEAQGISLVYGCSYQNYYHNSVVVNGATGYAANFGYNAATNVSALNNIFACYGCVALSYSLPGGMTSDYNLLYSDGPALTEDLFNVTIPDLQSWRNASGQDWHSSNYKPSFTGAFLQPDISDSAAWAINGRGIQLQGMAADLNGVPRSGSLQNGVPDIGAYEIVPVSLPPAATAYPAAPSSGAVQTFMFAGDTVARVTWDPGAPVPANITVRQYSGQQPPAYNGGAAYFNTVIDASPGSYNYDADIWYRDSWLGTVTAESGLRMAKRSGTANWNVYSGSQSTVNGVANILSCPALTDFSAFSGVDGANLTPVSQPTVKSSGLVISDITGNSMHVSWTNGNGNARIVLAKAVTALTAVPVDNMIYNAAAFGMGSDLGASSFVVYNGSGNGVTITGLQSNVKYNLAVYEYNDNGSSKNYAATALKGYATTAVDYVAMLKAGVAVTETFDDSLSIGANLPVGWSFVETGAAANSAYGLNNGASSTGNTYSYGSNAASDRALGSLLTASLASRFGVKLVNRSASVVTSLVLQYTGEQWRRGGASTPAAPDRLSVQYSTDANAVGDASATWVSAANLDFGSVQTGTAIGNLNGNIAANRMQIVGSVTGLNLAPGAIIYIRFTDEDLAGNDDGLAIDDLSVIPFSNTYTAAAALPSGTYNDLNVAAGILSLDSAITVKTALNIENGAVLDLAGQKLTAKGQMYGNGTISGSDASILSVGGTGQDQGLRFTPGSNTLYQLLIAANASATLLNTLNIAPKGAVKTGTPAGQAILNANGNLVLKSDTSGTAQIAAVYGSLNGSVTVERWMQTDSSIRFLSHPFSTAILLNQMGDDISLNTSGGAGQNLWFYNAASANPSGISSLASDAFWTPFSSTATGWNAFQAIRLLKGPGAATLDITGPVNQGNVAIVAAGGATDSFVVIGNPYPSGLKLGNALASATAPGGSMAASAIWTWDPTKGNAGAFTVIPNSKFPAAKLPVCGAFVAMVTPGGSATLNFTETDKTVTGYTKTFFRADDAAADETPADVIIMPEGLELSIEKQGRVFDGAYIFFDKDAKEEMERGDAPKLENPNFNFSSLSSTYDKLSVDVRPFETGRQIGLDLVTAEQGKFTIKIVDFNLPAGAGLYLVDRYTDNEELLTANGSYDFVIDENPGSKGERFYLKMGRAANTVAVPSLTMELTPNPARDQVSLRVVSDRDGKASVRVLSVLGQQMKTFAVDVSNGALVSLPLADLAPGIYMVELALNGQKTVSRLVKQ